MIAILASREAAMKDIALNTDGIDSLLDNPDLVKACSNKIPLNTPDLRKAARLPRT